MADGFAQKDPRTLTSINEILSCLSAFQSEEAVLSNSLTKLLADRDAITSSLAQLQSLVHQLNDSHLEASLLSDKVFYTAQTAERVGGRVRTLDEEMKRVTEAADRVGQVIELKSLLLQLQSSMESQDWESATRYCSRAMSFPLEVISGAFAETTVPTTESHLPPAQTLQAAREHLLLIFKRNFEQASRLRDAAATSRFFKLFPVIGWESEGLDAYASFVVDLVRVRGPAAVKTSSPLYYVTALTALFENIAMIVDQHQPVVEKYYGAGKMTSVIQRLLEECDRVVHDTVEGWKEDRSIDRKLADTAASSSVLSRKQPLPAEEDEIDPREIDKLLTELAGMAGRWALFRKFLIEQLTDDTETGSEMDSVQQMSRGLPVELNATLPSAPQSSVQLVDSTSSHQLFHHLLATFYTPLEIWYLRTIIEKAHRLSSPDRSQSPVLTTMPDDAFYLLKIVSSRLISTGSLKIIEQTIAVITNVMDHDYAGAIKKKLDDVYRTAGSSASVSRGDKAERENRLSFIMLLNDLDISAAHTERLVKDLLAHPSISQAFLPIEQTEVKNAIQGYTALVPKLRSLLRVGIEQLFNQLMRPKLRTLVPDVYKEVSYVQDDDAYSMAEYQDIVRKRFVKFWEGLIEGYKDTLTDNNFRSMFGLALDVLLRPWEKFITTMHFSELGAIRFDRDLRAITTYLSEQTIFGDIRGKFTRLQQISTLLNLDNDEDVDAFYTGSGISWALSLQEARTIVGLKV